MRLYTGYIYLIHLPLNGIGDDELRLLVTVVLPHLQYELVEHLLDGGFGGTVHDVIEYGGLSLYCTLSYVEASEVLIEVLHLNEDLLDGG